MKMFLRIREHDIWGWKKATLKANGDKEKIIYLLTKALEFAKENKNDAELR